ncbi:MAG: 50S ribosomal protein L24e [Candidatus ainarchaeum sp.]|nr:50S ribosomal protein L24e [Candidatus ainarchaeum sp.]MDD3975786.1 50S ribosomal protein L24e [Candidatus ainarchaeum sp.]
MKCTFCGKEIPEGSGIIYAKKDGTVYNFCSSKCKITVLNKKYKPHRTKWTDKYHLEKSRIKKKI